MGKRIEVPFAVQSGDAGVKQNSAERLVNMYAELTSGASPLVRRQRPGLRTVYAIAGEKRCIERNGAYHYCIIGQTLYRFDGLALTTLGTIETLTGLCTMVFNDNGQILVSDNVKLYYWNGSALAAVTVPSGFVPGPVAYLGGFGVVNDTSTNGRFYCTAANNFATIDALDFATAESSPDPLYRVFADHNELWLAGLKGIEIWSLTGAADFPFQASVAAKIERGTAGAMSFAGEDNTVCWHGEDGLIYRNDGYRPTVISTPAIAARLKALKPYWSSEYALVHTHGNYKFYVLVIPGFATFVYNLATQLWSEYGSYLLDHWAVIGGAGRATDYYLTATGICELVTGLSTDEGGIMIRKAVSAPGWADGDRITIPSMLVNCMVGRAATGVSASLMMRVALDGETFGNNRTESLGATGAYKTRVMFRNLGQGRKPVIELSISDAAELAIMSVLTEAERDPD